MEASIASAKPEPLAPDGDITVSIVVPALTKN